MIYFLKILISIALSISMLSISSFAQTQKPENTTSVEATPELNYIIGRGRADITGPALGLQMWGYSHDGQTTKGIHIRQYARAFIIAEPNEGKRVVFMSADIGSIEHNIVLEVVDRLQVKYNDLYTVENVILSATHTHSGASGYWHTSKNLGIMSAFYQERFDHIVTGIVSAISNAHEGLKPGHIMMASGDVEGSGKNRSLIAYKQNPETERARYNTTRDKEMTLLKFINADGNIGIFNWHAVHPTSMTYDNNLISGDHKGYAALAFERLQGVDSASSDGFVAAFAQTTPGDVTANLNLDNTGPGKDMFETTKIIATRQIDAAVDLFANAQEQLKGGIDTRHIYVNLSNYSVDDSFTQAGTQTTCPSAYGYSFAGGSSEDGGGHKWFREGMTQYSWWRNIAIKLTVKSKKPSKTMKKCHAPKPILFDTGTGNPSLQSQIRPFTIARIGQLVIVALPAEITTMSARRIKAAVMDELGDWAGHIVIAGYSNGFAGYITTPEEYLIQQYEGGHTLHGQWSLPAYQQITSQLAQALNTNTQVSSDVFYDDRRGTSKSHKIHDGKADKLPEGLSFGYAFALAQDAYSQGESVVARFVSGHPSAKLGEHGNFLTVEQKTGDDWIVVANDGDWSTKISWAYQNGKPKTRILFAKIEWAIPADQNAGQYRIRHLGQYVTENGEIKTFETTSSVFEVK